MESYFDGSSNTGDWRKGDWITLAGFAADDDVWIDFDKKWREILYDSSHRPAAKYLHMREATKLKGPFTYKKGWNLKKVAALVFDLLKFMQTVDKKRFRQFACTIDLRAYRKLIAEGFVFNDPIEICNDYCPAVVLAWYVSKYSSSVVIHSAHFFFDIEEPFKIAFEERWKKEKENIFDPAANREIWSLIKTVDAAEMRDKPAMQAADLLAWSSNRVCASDLDASFRHLEPIMKNIIPSTWIVFGEVELRTRYSQIKKGEHFRAMPGRYGVY